MLVTNLYLDITVKDNSELYVVFWGISKLKNIDFTEFENNFMGLRLDFGMA